jgi:hypothetical protein
MIVMNYDEIFKLTLYVFLIVLCIIYMVYDGFCQVFPFPGV